MKALKFFLFIICLLLVGYIFGVVKVGKWSFSKGDCDYTGYGMIILEQPVMQFKATPSRCA